MDDRLRISDEPELFKVDMLFGRVAIDSWFECREGQMVGMGRSRVYDRDGKLVRQTIAPTGVVMTLN